MTSDCLGNIIKPPITNHIQLLYPITAGKSDVQQEEEEEMEEPRDGAGYTERERRCIHLRRWRYDHDALEAKLESPYQHLVYF